MKVISFALTMFAIVGMISYAPVSATNGDEGCTPGFWKANAKKGANAWPDDIPIEPTTLLSFYGIVNVEGFSLSDVTFLDALSLKGGNSLSEKEEILLRAGAAALLNAAHLESQLDYEYNFEIVVAHLNAALASNDKDIIVAQAAAFDAENNEGCPFNNSGRP